MLQMEQRGQGFTRKLVDPYHKIGKMISKKQIGLVEVLRKNLHRSLSFSELKKESGISSNNFIQGSLEKFRGEEIIESKKRGGAKFYSLKVFPKTVHYFPIISFDRYDVPEDIIEAIIDEASRESIFFSLVVFGSYAKNEQTKKSDIDVCLIVGGGVDGFEARMKRVARKSIKKIHYYIFSEKEFKAMLDSEKENVGKEIARHNLVYYNAGAFYKLIEKWNQR